MLGNKSCQNKGMPSHWLAKDGRRMRGGNNGKVLWISGLPWNTRNVTSSLSILSTPPTRLAEARLHPEKSLGQRRRHKRKSHPTNRSGGSRCEIKLITSVDGGWPAALPSPRPPARTT